MCGSTPPGVDVPPAANVFAAGAHSSKTLDSTEPLSQAKTSRYMRSYPMQVWILRRPLPTWIDPGGCEIERYFFMPNSDIVHSFSDH